MPHAAREDIYSGGFLIPKGSSIIGNAWCVMLVHFADLNDLDVPTHAFPHDVGRSSMTILYIQILTHSALNDSSAKHRSLILLISALDMAGGKYIVHFHDVHMIGVVLGCAQVRTAIWV